eukprot:TRINITY_DN15472_c0_g1_i3.p1 TRINITY_DN15472_c0_g1~~TRINITY_DN15472_c0_g1_i3.p1  ORF type:complete len:465 (+),score=18.06 TRINITY_DN15472_c0_g1_i3:359-1753(+)
MKTLLNILDIVAILPYYLELAMGGDGNASGFRVLRVIRVVRVFRLLKVARYADGIRLIMLVMGKLGDVLVLVLFVVVMSLILWGSCLFFIEGANSRFDNATDTWYRSVPADNLTHREVYSPFQSIPAAFWWAISTVTVVGYGDEIPESAGGKALATFAMLSGTFIIAIPASVFGSNFLAEYHRRGREKILEKQAVRQLRSDQLVKAIYTVQSHPTPHTNTIDAILLGILWSPEYATKAVRLLTRSNWVVTSELFQILSSSVPGNAKMIGHQGYYDIGPAGVEAYVVGHGHSTPESNSMSAGDSTIKVERVRSSKLRGRRLSRIMLPPGPDENRRLTLPQDGLRRCTLPQDDPGVISTLLNRSSFVSNGSASRRSKKPTVPCPHNPLRLHTSTPYATSPYTSHSSDPPTPPDLVILPATPDEKAPVIPGAPSTTTPATITLDADRVESVLTSSDEEADNDNAVDL